MWIPIITIITLYQYPSIHNEFPKLLWQCCVDWVSRVRHLQWTGLPLGTCWVTQTGAFESWLSSFSNAKRSVLFAMIETAQAHWTIRVSLGRGSEACCSRIRGFPLLICRSRRYPSSLQRIAASLQPMTLEQLQLRSLKICCFFRTDSTVVQFCQLCHVVSCSLFAILGSDSCTALQSCAPCCWWWDAPAERHCHKTAAGEVCMLLRPQGAWEARPNAQTKWIGVLKSRSRRCSERLVDLSLWRCAMTGLAFAGHWGYPKIYIKILLLGPIVRDFPFRGAELLTNLVYVLD